MVRDTVMSTFAGFYPPHDCTSCGLLLQGFGEGRPAELHMGTYTGLCYRCEGATSHVTHVYRDGAKQWSHPPHCPSHRRGRTGSVSYDDCRLCKGLGCIGLISWDSYPTCLSCATRFGADSLRMTLIRRGRQILEASQRARDKDLAAYRKAHRLKKRDALPEHVEREIWDCVYARHQHALSHLGRWADTMGVHR